MKIADEEIELDAVPYKFKFEFMLPHSLPSSIEGDCGHIRYVAKVVFDMPLWIDRYALTLFIHIVDPMHIEY